MNIDILDEVPQFPGGAWINHLLYGTILGITTLGALLICRMDYKQALIVANLLTFGVSASKKIFDYVTRGPSQGETASACVGKTLVTCLGIFIIWLI